MISINYTINKLQLRKIYGIAGAISILAIPYIILVFSNGSIETEQSFCPFKLLTGFPCPGCGIGKSIIFLYEGNIYKSFYYHLFGPFTVLFCIIAILELSVELFTHKEYFQKILFSTKLAYTLAIILGTYHFIRIIHFVATNNFDSILRQSIWK